MALGVQAKMASKIMSTHLPQQPASVTVPAAAASAAITAVQQLQTAATTTTTPSKSSAIDVTVYQQDDADTSFEIDEPDEDDFIYIESMHATALVMAAAAAASCSQPATPHKQHAMAKQLPVIATITDCLAAEATDAISGELENIDTDSPDSSVLHSGSSTPTTTDVADLSNHNAQLAATALPNGLHTPQQQLLSRQMPQHCSLSPAMHYHHYVTNNNNLNNNNNNSPQHNNSSHNNNNYHSPTYKQIAINGIVLVATNAAAAAAATADSPAQQQQQQTNASYTLADDNLSSSIATTVTTTTTEIDIDNITNASQQHSPRTAAQLQQCQPPITLSRQCRPQQQRISIAGDGNLNAVAHACKDDAIISACSAGHKRTQSAASQASQKSHLPSVESLQPKMQIWRWTCNRFKSTGIGKPSVHHAMIVIFLEYFAWGLLTMPVIQNLKQIFPHHTFLMNGMLLGIKGLLSFLSAPLVGALSDIWGRKIFFLVTVFFTCSPIPLLTINLSWFFAMISISGIFAVTFSVVFAYVADVTTIEERSRAYGLVSATFAASLVISPALGNVLMNLYGDAFVVAIGIAIAVLDIFFILVAVPESLPEKVRPSTWGAPINWEQADPFAALRKVGTNRTVMMQCVTVLLSNLPEAGQYSSIFVYLKWKIGFNTLEVSIFIAFVGILSISVQVTLGFFMRVFGAKSTIIIGLTFEMVQMLWFGLANEPWMMWGAGLLAALGSIAYPAISAFVSIHSNADSQGAVQGMLTGVRGLCNGLGPAVFGVIFYFFDVDLDETTTIVDGDVVVQPDRSKLVPGPPFLFGAVMVVIAICVAVFIPETPNAEEPTSSFSRTSSSDKKHVQYEIESGRKLSTTMLDARAPLMRSDSMAQL